MFPFTFNGVTYHECTLVGQRAPWCGVGYKGKELKKDLCDMKNKACKGC